MIKKNKPTLSEVAKLAGVSVPTASMIISQKPGVTFSPETIKKVMDAVEELNYIGKIDKLNNIAKVTDKIIAVICPNITNPYYATIVQSIEQAARQDGLDVILFNTYRDSLIEKRIVQTLYKLNVVGIIFAMMPSDPQFAEQLNFKLPIVVIGDSDCSVHIDTVEVSNYNAGVLIGKHLIDLGHKHIAFLSPTLDHINTARLKRLEGLKDTFKKAGNNYSILVKSQNITPDIERNNISIEHVVGYNLCKESLKEKKITAFVGLNDMISYGIIDAIIDSGYKIPTDYSICGFDNIFPSHLSPISLTSIEHCIEDIGHNAFNILLSKIDKETRPTFKNSSIIRVEYSQKLIQRNSTGPARS